MGLKSYPWAKYILILKDQKVLLAQLLFLLNEISQIVHFNSKELLDLLAYGFIIALCASTRRNKFLKKTNELLVKNLLLNRVFPNHPNFVLNNFFQILLGKIKII